MRTNRGAVDGVARHGWQQDPGDCLTLQELPRQRHGKQRVLAISAAWRQHQRLARHCAGFACGSSCGGGGGGEGGTAGCCAQRRWGRRLLGGWCCYAAFGKASAVAAGRSSCGRNPSAVAGRAQGICALLEGLVCSHAGLVGCGSASCASLPLLGREAHKSQTSLRSLAQIFTGGDPALEWLHRRCLQARARWRPRGEMAGAAQLPIASLACPHLQHRCTALRRGE